LCQKQSCELQELPLETLQSLNPAFDQGFYDCLRLDSVLSMHDVAGGTAPSRVRRALADARQRIDLISERVHAHA